MRTSVDDECQPSAGVARQRFGRTSSPYRPTRKQPSVLIHTRSQQRHGLHLTKSKSETPNCPRRKTHRYVTKGAARPEQWPTQKETKHSASMGKEKSKSKGYIHRQHRSTFLKSAPPISNWHPHTGEIKWGPHESSFVFITQVLVQWSRASQYGIEVAEESEEGLPSVYLYLINLAAPHLALALNSCYKSSELCETQFWTVNAALLYGCALEQWIWVTNVGFWASPRRGDIPILPDVFLLCMCQLQYSCKRCT